MTDLRRITYLAVLLAWPAAISPALAQSGPPQIDQERIWHRADWPGGILGWRNPDTDQLFDGDTTRIFWITPDRRELYTFTGSLGLALLELERSEGVDINELLARSDYLVRQYDSVVAELGRPAPLAGFWEAVELAARLGTRRVSGGIIDEGVVLARLYQRRRLGRRGRE